MSYCDGIITKNLVGASCDAPAVKGLERLGVLVNREDIDFSKVTFDETDTNVLTALALKSGKKGVSVIQVGQQPYTGSGTKLAAGTYGNTFDNTLVVALLNNSVENSDAVDTIANGEYVFISEYKDKGAESASAFRVAGFYNGLVLTDFAHDPYGDTFGGGLLTLTETGASRSAIYLGKTYDAGKKLFDSLLSPAV